MSRVVIEIDRIDPDAPGGPELRAVGYIGPLGTRVATAARARRLHPADADELIRSLRAEFPNLILRVVPEPRPARALERAMAGQG
jgi:hypothetical protein